VIIGGKGAAVRKTQSREAENSQDWKS